MGGAGGGGPRRIALAPPHARTRPVARSPALVRVTVPVEGGGRAEVVTDAHTRGEGAMAAVCAVTVEGGADGAGASYGAVWGVGEEAAVCVGALQMLVAHVVGDKKPLGEGVDAVVRLDGGEGGGGGELVVKQLTWAQHKRKWLVAGEDRLKLQVCGRAALPLAPSHPLCVHAQVDGRVGFEAAVSAATGELRAGVAVERGEVARMQRSYRTLRAELARMGVSTLATLVAERDAARAAAADSTAALATCTTERDLARAALASRSAELAAVLRERAAADDVEREMGAVSSVLFDPVIIDAIARKVATPLTTAAAGLYLRGRGFPAGSQPAGITWGIDSVPAGRLTASSVRDDSEAVHPGCRLMYPNVAVAGKNCFCTMSGYPAGEWVCVDLGGERSVAGALVQGWEGTDACSEVDGYSWFRHKFQWSADGAAWTDVDGGRVWSRDGLAWEDVLACVFGAPVRCRYLRIVAVSNSGALRWEVVVLP
jgi:hypothetical protein